MGRGTWFSALCMALLWAWTVGSAQGELAWQSDDGDHSVNVELSTRFRVEGWDARSTNTDWFSALRTRIGLKYAWKERLRAFIQFQDARLHGLSDEASGAGALYRANSGDESRVHHDRIRQLWLEYQVTDDLSFRVGRQDIKLGMEVMYQRHFWFLLGAAVSSSHTVLALRRREVRATESGRRISAADFVDPARNQG